ncbi:MAG: sugar phosphate isomerase/epimerase [Verrucomicrobia bacterium]|nr:sugar phosphate isomerase/epimerase [Verrucomicrobiota bacterium]
MKHPSRRNFLRTAGITAASLSGASLGNSVLAVNKPFNRAPGGARLRLGLAAYSMRNYFSWMKGKPKKGVKEPQITMNGFVDFCAKHNCGGAELTSYFFPGDADEQYYADMRAYAHQRGVEICGTAVGNNFSNPKGSEERAKQMEYVKLWIDRAALMGAPHIRVFAGGHPKGVSEADAERFAAESLEEAGEYAGKKGIMLGIENHDSISDSGRLLRIVKAVKSPWVGVNLDTGNFRTTDPYKDIAETAPYAVNVQLKMNMRDPAPGPADLDRIGKIIQDSGYQGYVVLEYEEDDNPFEKVPAVLDQMRKFCNA